MANILVLHGPNLNLLGTREPKHYGNMSLSAINSNMEILATELNHTVSAFQSNDESKLINRIHECLRDKIDFIIFNPAAFTHTSIALRDALLAVNIPFVEVHLSNIHSRESFRHHSYFSDIAIGVISGLGSDGYSLALRYADSYLTNHLNLRSHEPLWTCEKSAN
ncbi:MAG: type II 3-dehydroquinate dehydratase [Gammaproteobacteria bacterium]